MVGKTQRKKGSRPPLRAWTRKSTVELACWETYSDICFYTLVCNSSQEAHVEHMNWGVENELHAAAEFTVIGLRRRLAILELLENQQISQRLAVCKRIRRDAIFQKWLTAHTSSTDSRTTGKRITLEIGRSQIRVEVGTILLDVGRVEDIQGML